MKNKLLKLLACSGALIAALQSSPADALLSGIGGSKEMETFLAQQKQQQPPAAPLRKGMEQENKTNSLTKTPQQLLDAATKKILAARDHIATLSLGIDRHGNNKTTTDMLTPLLQDSITLNKAAQEFEKDYANPTRLTATDSYSLAALLTACGRDDATYNITNIQAQGWREHETIREGYTLETEYEDNYSATIRNIEQAIGRIRARALNSTGIDPTYTAAGGELLNACQSLLFGKPKDKSEITNALPDATRIYTILKEM